MPTILRERVRPAEITEAIQQRGVTHTTLVQAALVELGDHLGVRGALDPVDPGAIRRSPAAASVGMTPICIASGATIASVR